MGIIKTILRVVRIGVGALLILVSSLAGALSLFKKADPEPLVIIGEWIVYVVIFIIGLALVRVKRKEEKDAQQQPEPDLK